MPSITLQTWSGFRRHPDFWSSRSVASDGSASLYIASPTYQQSPPSQAQSAALNYLIEHEQAVYRAVLQAIFEDYPSRRHNYGYDSEQAGEDRHAMPDIEHPEQLKMLIGLNSVSVLVTAKHDVAYLRFDFGAAWDPEHGFNVTIHQDRVIFVGDTGAGEYHAQNDAKRE